jgi:hypothetical protein
MSSEKRTIKINPELFKISDKNTSRKKKEKNDIKIKVKSEKPLKNKSLRRSVMKMIRDKQQEEYKKLFSKEKERKNPDFNENLKFNKDFENSLDYFNSLVEKDNEKKKESHNHTFKRYPEQSNIYENVSMELPNVFDNIVPVNTSIPVKINKPPQKIVLPQPPKYGCLKNGILPTYRSYYNTTQRSYPQVNINKNNEKQEETQKETQQQTQQEQKNLIDYSNSIRKNDLSEKRQKLQKGELIKSGKQHMKYLKRRKIYKRTYKIGKSKTKPQISVLVSNKTIRNKITTDAQLLKQTPIHDVKKFLVKKGLIKVGTNTPNDVLRKMYETVSMICGDIQNHNSENLLYNFINPLL